jgi:mannose-6-phosphate isomerase-like protein (cupin superfamily)
MPAGCCSPLPSISNDEFDAFCRFRIEDEWPFHAAPCRWSHGGEQDRNLKETAMPVVADRIDILNAAWTNEAFRREVLTGDHEQVVVMAIPVGGEIGEEVHPHTDQVFLFVDGRGQAEIGGRVTEVGPNELVFVRAGTRHNFTNMASTLLRLITVYAPPQHAVGTVHLTKEEADAAEH